MKGWLRGEMPIVKTRDGDGDGFYNDGPRQVPVPRQTKADMLRKLADDFDQIMVTAVLDGGGDYPDCLVASNLGAERLSGMGAKVSEGLYHYSDDPHGKLEHAWIELPDTTIIDLTRMQFEPTPYRDGDWGHYTIEVFPPGHPMRARYRRDPNDSMWDARWDEAQIYKVDYKDHDAVPRGAGGHFDEKSKHQIIQTPKKKRPMLRGHGQKIKRQPRTPQEAAQRFHRAMAGESPVQKGFVSQEAMLRGLRAAQKAAAAQWQEHEHPRGPGGKFRAKPGSRYEATPAALELLAGRPVGPYSPDPSTLPPKPGTAPIPDGAVRLYHYSREENIPSLINNGILKQKAIGETYGEPNMVWASAQQPGPEVPYVEFYAYGEELDIGRGSGRGGAFAEGEVEWMEGRGSNVTLLGDVPPERIVSYHEPWIDAVRYLEDGSIDAVFAGEYDYIGDNLPREKRAIDWIKEHYRAPDTSGVSVFESQLDASFLDPHDAVQAEIRAFDELPPDQLVAIYHGTTADNAEAIVRSKKAGYNPRGDVVSDASAHQGLYVAPTWKDANTYAGKGGRVVRFIVRRDQVIPSPEAGQKSPGKALYHSFEGAIVLPGTDLLEVEIIDKVGKSIRHDDIGWSLPATADRFITILLPKLDRTPAAVQQALDDFMQTEAAKMMPKGLSDELKGLGYSVGAAPLGDDFKFVAKSDDEDDGWPKSPFDESKIVRDLLGRFARKHSSRLNVLRDRKPRAIQLKLELSDQRAIRGAVPKRRRTRADELIEKFDLDPDFFDANGDVDEDIVARHYGYVDNAVGLKDYLGYEHDSEGAAFAWIYHADSRAIRKAAFDILDAQSSADVHVNRQAYGGSGVYGYPHDWAFAMLESLKESEPQNTVLYRGVDLSEGDATEFLLDHQPGAIFDAPLMAFATHPEIADQFGTTVRFRLAPGARGLRGGAMPFPWDTEKFDDGDITEGDYMDYLEGNEVPQEIISGGRFRVVHVYDEVNPEAESGHTTVIEIGQLGVFDPMTKHIRKEVPCKKSKWDRYYDGTLIGLAAKGEK